MNKKLIDSLELSGELREISAEIPYYSVVSDDSDESSEPSGYVTVLDKCIIPLNTDDNVSIEKVQRVDNRLNPLLKKEILLNNSMTLGLDENNNIISISNPNPAQPETDSNLDDVLNNVITNYGLDDSYKKRITNNTEGFTDYYWEKQYENGIINPYDSLSLSLNKHNEIELLTRFNEKPSSTEIQITESVALSEGKKVINNTEEIIAETCQLQYVKPNFYWNEDGLAYDECNVVRLAYVITLNNTSVVYIDALTGENIGGSEFKGDARAFAYSGFQYAVATANLAKTGFGYLGYNALPIYFANSNYLGTAIELYISSLTAYGFYVSCHGTPTSLGDNATWIYYSAQVTGNWHFVFLDACDTGVDTTWASAFKIYGYSSRAFLGWSNVVTVTNAYSFCQYFWPEVIKGSQPVEYVARWAAAQVPGSGTTPIRFYGDNSYNGREY